MTDFQLKLLKHLNIDLSELDEYQRIPTLEDLESPYNFLGMEKAVIRIRKALSNNEKIMIYGDYDCDGISATSILVKMFQYLNKKVGYYIPSRYIDGYGLNLNRAKQIVEKGYDLVITVDNGVMAHEAIEYLTENQIDVILTDHHEISKELPKCLCVLHPDLKKDNNILKQCGAYVAFMLSIGVLDRIDDYLLTLAGLATISDMMPLIKMNRTIVKLALERMNGSCRYPYRYLLKDNEDISEETLGFSICPKINAYGRMKEDLSVNEMVMFFVSEDKYTLNRLTREIELCNSYRREILTNSINLLNFEDLKKEKISIICLDNISEGVIGLIAARILNECNHPCIVFTKSIGENMLKGSARSLKGVSLTQIFTDCADLLETYGGHEEAGGLSIKVENFNEFKKRVIEMSNHFTIQNEDEKVLEINSQEINYENYLFVKSLAPFGVGFNMPKFAFNIDVSLFSYLGRNNEHIKANISDNASLIGFNLANKIKFKSEVKVIGTMSKDNYHRGNHVSFKIETII